MGAQDHVFLRLARQVARHVADRLHLALQLHRRAHLDGIRQGERLRLQVLVDGRRELLQVLAGRREPFLDRRRLHLHKRDPGVDRPRGASELLQVVRIAAVVGAVRHQQHAHSTVAFGVDRLAPELRVPGEELAHEHALLVVFLRLVAQHHHDLVFHIQARVVVVVVLGRRDPVTRKHQPPSQFPAGGEVERQEILLELQGLLAAVPGVLEVVVRPQPGVGGHRESLEIVPGHRLQPRRAELLLDVFRRLLQAGRARPPAFQLGRGQVLDVAQVAVGIDIGGPQAQGGDEDSKSEESQFARHRVPSGLAARAA